MKKSFSKEILFPALFSFGGTLILFLMYLVWMEAGIISDQKTKINQASKNIKKNSIQKKLSKENFDSLYMDKQKEIEMEMLAKAKKELKDKLKPYFRKGRDEILTALQVPTGNPDQDYYNARNQAYYWFNDICSLLEDYSEDKEVYENFCGPDQQKQATQIWDEKAFKKKLDELKNIIEVY